MSNIVDINEAWHNHSGLEVETFIKSRITAALAASGGKIGHVELVGSNIIFYDEEGGTAIATIPLGGDVYNISVGIDLGTVFYILADEPTKTMTINASTTVSSFGSSESENFPEAYSYIVAVNTGGGYVNRISGTFNSGESSSFDIRPYIATGDNYIRIAVTGLTSGHTKTIVCTATLPAQLDIADSYSNGENIVISDSRDAMNAEIISLKQKSIDIINSVDYHKSLINQYDKLLADFNPEMAEKQAQQQEIAQLRNQMDEMSKNMALLIEQLKQKEN